MIFVDGERCTGCGACVAACTAGAMHLAEAVATVEQALCRGCGACVEACSEGAICSVAELTVASPLLPQPVATEVLPPASMNRAGVAGLVATARPWLGAAAAFVGREVLPRVAASLLDSWQRSDVDGQPEGAAAPWLTSGSGATEAPRHRHRQRRGHL
jgi:NAD-dependent dihydropyrimidine dehydrogenase PreA subunit